MSVNDNVNKQSVSRGLELELELLIAGALTLPPTTQLVVDGVSYTPATFVDRARTELAPFKAVRAAELVTKQARADRRTRTPGTKVFVADARAAVQGAIGSANPDLEKFGMKPRKQRQPETLEQKVARVEKAKATREKRGQREPTDGSQGGPAPRTP